MAQQLALNIEKLSKTFGQSTVLRATGLEIQPGEIHAIVGHNGSGKSTLVKCLSGYYAPDAGATVSTDGIPLEAPWTSRQATAAGLRFVHQDLGIVPSLTVTENLSLGNGFNGTRIGAIRWRQAHAHAREMLERVGCEDVSPKCLVGELPPALRTMVAVARAMHDSSGSASVIFLDEPTVSLPQKDAEILHAAIRHMADRGVAVALISHRMSEILELATRITVLRDGRRVGTYPAADLDHDSLLELMLGHLIAREIREMEMEPAADEQRAAQADALVVRDLCGGAVSDLSLGLGTGEIVGLAGLRGSGRSTTARLLGGSQPVSAGTILIRGKEVRFRGISDAVRAGVVYVSENRQRDGAIGPLSVRENLLLPRLRDFRHPLFGLRRSRMVSEAAKLTKQYNVRPSQPKTAMSRLSGGNQQKVILARWLSLNPVAAILDEPFQGIDVGAKNELFHILRRAANNGLSILLVDSDFENLSSLCDRVLVIDRGHLSSVLEGPAVRDADSISKEVFRASHVKQDRT